MTDIEQKALALLNEVLAERVHWQMTGSRTDNASIEALSRAIEQHEATKEELHDLRQKVSDIASVYNKMAFTVTEIEPHLSNYRVIIGFDKIADASMCHDRLVSLLDFLNPKPKPDPLVAVLLEIQISSDLQESQHDAIEIRKALDALGFEIRKKNDAH